MYLIDTEKVKHIQHKTKHQCGQVLYCFYFFISLIQTNKCILYVEIQTPCSMLLSVYALCHALEGPKRLAKC